MGSILTGPAIREAIEAGRIEIDPLKMEHINPASIDLTLGKGFRVYTSANYRIEDQVQGILSPHSYPPLPEISMAEKNDTAYFEIPDEGLVLKQGILYLMHTAERVFTKHYASILDGKSSIGRLGICVHLTAGYGDPGFNGQYTLEVTCVNRVRVFAGRRFCQMRFQTLEGEVVDYRETGSHYLGKSAMGPVASMSWKQFEEQNQ